MSLTNEAAIHELAVRALHDAIRRAAGRVLDSTEPLAVSQFRQVERLMRLAIAVAGSGSRVPYVEVHGIPAGSDEGTLPQVLSIDLTDLLAARAADHLPGALRGEAESLRVLAEQADRILATEDIQLG